MQFGDKAVHLIHFIAALGNPKPLLVTALKLPLIQSTLLEPDPHKLIITRRQQINPLHPKKDHPKGRPKLLVNRHLSLLYGDVVLVVDIEGRKG